MTDTIKTAEEITKVNQKPRTNKPTLNDSVPNHLKNSPNMYEGFDFKVLGRPTKYSLKVMPKVGEFIELRVSQNNIPTIEGLGLYIGISKDTIYQWKKKHKRFSYALTILLQVQGEMLQSNGLKGWYNPTITQLLLKNNHAFQDKHQIDHTSEGKRIEKIDYIIPETQPDPTDPADPTDPDTPIDTEEGK